MGKRAFMFLAAGWLLAALIGPRELFAKLRG